ncbi:DUF58 domain-containing protein [Herbidospora sp. NEAU-GS84]|uniref:DUF58 domain-containing protein n=1 Tax=Herbidospora solisilvae TaxID=2696284 RepID=A0A7C9N6A9_9ACTN|nr:DUF58 domain-containing protein [Herbidospora solisilvae]NAS26074.1 DUF58 domain-containing protein [Herbidospora solisilvae]
MTRTGKAVLLLAVICLAAGLLADYPEMVATGTTLALLVAAALPWAAAPPHLSAEIRLSPSITSAGGTAEVTLVLRGAVRVRELGLNDLALAVPKSRPGETVEISVVLNDLPRGRHLIGPVRVAGADPLRLVERSAVYGTAQILHVHPYIWPVPPLRVPFSPDDDGEASPYALRGGVIFKELRPYVAGDDRRLIHWKSSARHRELMVRESVIFDRADHVVVLDTGADYYRAQEFEEALSIVASVSVAAARHAHPVRVVTTCGAEAASIRGRDGTVDPGPVLRLLSGLSLGPAPSPSPPLVPPGAAGYVTGRLPASDLVSEVTVIVVDPGRAAPASDWTGQLVVRSAGDFAARWTAMAGG